MARRRKARLRRISGGERRTHSSKPVERRYDWDKEAIVRPFAAIATRKLRFAQINRLLNDQPPSKTINKDVRVYLFRSGEDRDDFVEAFHRDYGARAYQLDRGPYGSQEEG